MGADVPIPPVALKLWELLDDLEGRGLLRPDATFEEFEALMERLETTSEKAPEAP
jgi:hypothetical protein